MNYLSQALQDASHVAPEALFWSANNVVTPDIATLLGDEAAAARAIALSSLNLPSSEFSISQLSTCFWHVSLCAWGGSFAMIFLHPGHPAVYPNASMSALPIFNRFRVTSR